jgi:hypothetical protein
MRTAIRGTIAAIVQVPKQMIGLLSAPTLAVLGGAGLLIWGLHMIYEPLAYIVPGIALAAFGSLAALRMAQGRDE